MYLLDVNADEVVVLTNKLEKLSQTAFPNAVRKTLNDTALDVKKVTLPQSSQKNFTRREKAFFKRFSRVLFVTEKRNVNTMRSEVGMYDGGLFGDNSYAVKNLEQQEHGGTIGGRTLIPTDAARTGKKRSRMVSRRHRISNIPKIHKAKGKSKPAWLLAARKAGKGGFIMGTFKPLVFRITSIGKRVKMVPVYYINKKGTVRVKAKHFAEQAAEASAKKLPYIYKQNAKQRFERIMR